MFERRAAFYAKMLDGNKLNLNDEEAEEWRRDLPKVFACSFCECDAIGNGEGNSSQKMFSVSFNSYCLMLAMER